MCPGLWSHHTLKCPRNKRNALTHRSHDRFHFQVPSFPSFQVVEQLYNYSSLRQWIVQRLSTMFQGTREQNAATHGLIHLMLGMGGAFLDSSGKMTSCTNLATTKLLMPLCFNPFLVHDDSVFKTYSKVTTLLLSWCIRVQDESHLI